MDVGMDSIWEGFVRMSGYHGMVLKERLLDFVSAWRSSKPSLMTAGVFGKDSIECPQGAGDACFPSFQRPRAVFRSILFYSVSVFC